MDYIGQGHGQDVTGPAFVVTGVELDDKAAREMFLRILGAELDNWVPDASQRLLYRAGRALGIHHPVMPTDNPDCGAEPGWHALTSDWVAGVFVRRCVTCSRLYADGSKL